MPLTEEDLVGGLVLPLPLLLLPLVGVLVFLGSVFAGSSPVTSVAPPQGWIVSTWDEDLIPKDEDWTPKDKMTHVNSFERRVALKARLFIFISTVTQLVHFLDQSRRGKSEPIYVFPF